MTIIVLVGECVRFFFFQICGCWFLFLFRKGGGCQKVINTQQSCLKFILGSSQLLKAVVNSVSMVVKPWLTFLICLTYRKIFLDQLVARVYLY